MILNMIASVGIFVLGIFIGAGLYGAGMKVGEDNGRKDEK